ncbi:MAG: glycosyltransferase family 2 protein [Planctomycetaceae bacterium]
MTAAPKISVLVTVFNRELWLEQTLHSILSSTFTDFEVIVVDDCSTDDSPMIARRVAEADHRILFVQNDANLGDYGNRMKVASLASGDYLKYVDSDELIYPHTLQVMIDAMNRYPDAVAGLAHSMPEDEQPYPGICHRNLPTRNIS